MSKFVDSFLCGVASLKTGSKIICYVILVISFITSVVFTGCKNVYKFQGNAFFNGSLTVSMCVIGTILAAMAIRDIAMKTAPSIFAVVVWTAMMIIYQIIGLICIALRRMTDDNDPDNYFVFNLIDQIITLVVEVYFFMVLYSYQND